MKIVHSQLNSVPQPEVKQVPIYKDRAAIEQAKRILIADNNERLKRLRAKQESK